MGPELRCFYYNLSLEKITRSTMKGRRHQFPFERFVIGLYFPSARCWIGWLSTPRLLVNLHVLFATTNVASVAATVGDFAAVTHVDLGTVAAVAVATHVFLNPFYFLVLLHF